MENAAKISYINFRVTSVLIKILAYARYYYKIILANRMNYSQGFQNYSEKVSVLMK